MNADSKTIDADLVGSASPPRDNGEIVFGAPWERRVFGLTVAACRSGACDWDDFRRRLIARIAEDETRPYWQNWAAALEEVLEHTAVVEQRELDHRHDEFMRRSAGFDHHS
ncbi:nitrile hydratase accessory protein [Mycobacterium deserti]|uniref:Nitrile hydratase accessory protein n=1 Tax=Mycobacterium deserti TaxID=2978347 RepID=A0ABT2M754_9MYCO|nr:nitrile hydratase accessory protein [Mycobacterium deserti]MCT7658100.1 nitrile hydratase accessory protein [Mycobacterium deserti]